MVVVKVCMVVVSPTNNKFDPHHFRSVGGGGGK
jgi:hypothetical protein